MGLSGIRHLFEYHTIHSLVRDHHFTVAESCRALQVHRSAYYKWLHRQKSQTQRENERILAGLCKIYFQSHGLYGARRLADEYNVRYGTHYSDGRIRRLCRFAGLYSLIYLARTDPARHADLRRLRHVDDLIAHDFSAQAPNQKWLTDVTEMAYGSDGKKLYLSAILDLAARDIVAYHISPRNNNLLVHTTLDHAIARYPNARPILHSDHGVQYTSLGFARKLRAHGIIQSMSRVGKCQDNSPIEGFWGTLKAEMYHQAHFSDYESLARAIHQYIDFYNNRRRQRALDRLPPAVYRRRLAPPMLLTDPAQHPPNHH